MNTLLESVKSLALRNTQAKIGVVRRFRRRVVDASERGLPFLRRDATTCYVAPWSFLIINGYDEICEMAQFEVEGSRVKDETLYGALLTRLDINDSFTAGDCDLDYDTRAAILQQTLGRLNAIEQRLMAYLELIEGSAADAKLQSDDEGVIRIVPAWSFKSPRFGVSVAVFYSAGGELTDRTLYQEFA